MTRTDLYKIGDLARLVGKTPRALRLYEERGLLTPRERSEGGFRLYGDEAIARIHCLDQLQVLGLSLNAIAALLGELCDGRTGDEAATDLCSLLDASISRITEQIRQLEALRAELIASRGFVEGCRDCPETALFQACRDCEKTQASAVPDLIRGLISQPPRDIS